ncbi:hypothetical protein Lqui_2249 [Legionella quinlivanii]|uniref:Uncharacterized protein n=1 Tax=Legionella quinlivanii TaxID=45073 RepID=A0A0W0XT41_9GAMM|nr:hypothetical protein [Legionella quinlivanii]KTD47985.1 hypothetical protein Lqui_2249 [Legionella quinlivanii]SEG20639.1 hypothetical protein SAMN02746093_02175 [Legionella quinlivanii DSM 21216]STY11097.1 Uncharacterised protein [Legionella quinlivanii]
MNEDSLVINPEISSTEDINYPATEIADDWSDSDSFSDEDDSPHISYFSRDCILKLKIDVDERSLEPAYQLSAVPYVSKDNPLAKLKENNWCIGEQQAVYDHFQISGKDEILSQFKSLVNRTPLDINDIRYCLSFHAVIGGSLGKHLLPVRYYSREYSKEQFRLFISVADLLLRNVSLEDNAINEAFEYQQQAYGLFLSPEERKEVINKLNYHPARARKKHLNTIKAQWSVSESPQIGYSNPALDYLHTFGSWLSEQLVRFTQATSYVAPQTEVLEEGDRLNVIARLRANQYDSLTAQKNDLKRLIKLRSSYKPEDGFYARLVHTSRLSREFWHSINKPECWESPEIIEKARQLVLEHIILSDEILADMEYFIREAGFEPTPFRVAALLDNQDLPFGRTFIYSGIVDFYAYFREKGWTHVVNGLLINGKPAIGFEFAEPAQTNLLFFNKNSPEYKLRKLYNTFIKYGFYQRYGEENGEDFRKALSVADNRYVNWTSIDKKIDKPCPETWPQFFKRSILGGDQPTEESYTYSHPVHDTRPT